MYALFCSDREAEPASAASGGGEQRALQARDDPVLRHHGVLAHQHLDLVTALMETEHLPEKTGVLLLFKESSSELLKLKSVAAVHQTTRV